MAEQHPVAAGLQRQVEVLADRVDVSAMAAMVSGRRSFGCGLVNRTRRIPSTAPTAREQVGEQRAAAW